MLNLAGIDSAGNESSADYTMHTITLRYGGELLKPSKTRRKSAHLWAGVYYEMSWTRVDTRGDSSNDYDSRWVFCFGT